MLPGKTYQFSATHKIVAIGASTGGTEALKELLSPLPADFPGIVIVQHMPETFTHQFAERLDSLCRIRVKEAQDGDRILPGHALLAPGGHHMAVVRRGMEYAVHVYRGERVNRHIAFRGCLVFLVRPQHGEERSRGASDWHGRGRRARHVGDEAGMLPSTSRRTNQHVWFSVCRARRSCSMLSIRCSRSIGYRRLSCKGLPEPNWRAIRLTPSE